MSPPTSNVPRSPRRSPDSLRHVRTARELDVVMPGEARARTDAILFDADEVLASPRGLPLARRQAFPAFRDLLAQVPHSERPMHPLPQAPPEPRSRRKLAPSSTRQGEAELRQAATPVSVARMQPTGRQAQPASVPLPAPGVAPRNFFVETIVAGHSTQSVTSAAADHARADRQLSQTTCCDLRKLLNFPIPLPELGANLAADNSGRVTASATEIEPALAESGIEVREPIRDMHASAEQHSGADDLIDPGPPRRGARVAWIAIATALVAALGLFGLGLSIRRPRTVETQVARTGEHEVASPRSAAQQPSTSTRAPDPQLHAPEEGTSAAAPHHTPGEVTASSAAALYISGQHKEALTEYQLLARAAPKQPVYAEFVRILRRKLMETCQRRQPNRREQCTTM